MSGEQLSKQVGCQSSDAKPARSFFPILNSLENFGWHANVATLRSRCSFA